MLIKRTNDVPSSEITSKSTYLNRRRFITGAAVTGAALAAGYYLRSSKPATETVEASNKLTGIVKSSFSTTEPPNSFKDITNHVRSLNIPTEDLVVLSTDEGNVKKALNYQKRLGGQLSVVDKRRTSATETKAAHLIGAAVEGKTVVLFDDMISTAGSVVGAAHVARRNGARAVYACATHAVLCGPAIERLHDSPLKQIVVTDSIPLPPHKQLPRIKVLSVAPLLADAIKRIHFNESVSRLFE